MNNPGTLQNNFLSTRGVKATGDAKVLGAAAGNFAYGGQQQGLSLYFSLMKNKKLPDTKKAVQKAKQIVLRSPSNQARQSGNELNTVDDTSLVNKENSKKLGNISKFTASKILFPEERKTQR